MQVCYIYRCLRFNSLLMRMLCNNNATKREIVNTLCQFAGVALVNAIFLHIRIYRALEEKQI